MTDKKEKPKETIPTPEAPQLDPLEMLNKVKDMIPEGMVDKMLSGCNQKPQEELSEFHIHIIGSESMILKILGKE